MWPKCTGMNEEIAVMWLMKCEYKVEKALKQLESKENSYQIVTMINQQTQFDAKIEYIGYIHMITEPPTNQ